MMALRYPTQPLRIAATASVHSILHFVNFEENQQIPSFSEVVTTFANLRPPTAYTMIKDRQQVEYNYTATIRARARCALPLAQEFHPVEWLHMPISPKTGAVASFADWNEKELLKTLKTAIQRLGGRDHGQEPSGIRHAFVCDTSRMYIERTEPRPNTAAILQATTCWSKPEVVDQTVHQEFRKIKDLMQMIAQTPPVRSMFISKELPVNPKMAMEIFLDLVARQSNHSSPVLENFTSFMKKYREIFTQLGHKQFADSLPEPKPRTQPSKPPTLQVLKSYADGSSSTQVTELRPINTAPTMTNTGTARASLTTTAPDSVTAPTDMVPTANLTLQRPEQMMTQTEMADIEAELNALVSDDQNCPPNQEDIRRHVEDN